MASLQKVSLSVGDTITKVQKGAITYIKFTEDNTNTVTSYNDGTNPVTPSIPVVPSTLKLNLELTLDRDDYLFDDQGGVYLAELKEKLYEKQVINGTTIVTELVGKKQKRWWKN